ncbi:SDR family oxidoreductase [Brasilonema sp. UFV-L1]|uniref:SDR family NAD(P)-dependent oxidoreductase n=1 Tax=Brasilonema sp. UFV-L1 TaxID=2234130 RepID=UPI00145E47C6|nr:SDR family oxidoreductase [Brasilonema sp. UFV-L1]NMG06790.1 SDR family NAD(P)-dependent oxidoreductase [Brasilonema sp. UFV-L1]
MTQEKFLLGRVAMVTGGASGIGRAMALAFAQAGADVAIGSRTASTSPCKNEIEARGVRALAMNLDVTSANSVLAFYEAVVKTFGKVDILANSAGIGAEQSICNHPDEVWDQLINVNLNGVYRTIKLCLPGMISRRWGRIINIASTAAEVGSPTNAAYCASKAAVVGLTRCVALEGAPYGVTCNAISPGWVETKLGKSWMTEIAETSNLPFSEYIQQVKQANPQKRMIQPEEIGSLAVFLCRDEALGITMQNITVSAGSLW